MSRVRTWAAVLAAVCTAGWCAAQPIPALTGRVVDQADLLSVGMEAQLADLLAAYESTTTHQVVVLTIPSLDGEAIETYATRVFRAWALGREDADNGVLLLVARDDRELRIEVGYGLEPSLSDAEAGRIIRNVIVPLFREGDFEGGIYSGVTAIMSAADARFAPPAPAVAPGRRFGGGEAFASVVLLLGLLAALGLARGWVVKTGGKGRGARGFSFAARWLVGGGGLGLALFLGAPLLHTLTGLGRVEWWPGLGFGFLLWPVLTLLVEAGVRRSPRWRRYRKAQAYVERRKADARRRGKEVTIHTWGRVIRYDGRPPTTSSSGSSWSGSSGSSYSSSSSFRSSSSFSSSSFSGGGGSSGGGGASGSW